MTKEDHKSAIVQQLQQQSLNLLVDSLAAALAEIEQLKAAAVDKPRPLTRPRSAAAVPP